MISHEYRVVSKYFVGVHSSVLLFFSVAHVDTLLVVTIPTSIYATCRSLCVDIYKPLVTRQ